MRFLVCGLVLLAASASPVFAGDFGDLLLRGSAQPAADPPNYPRWAGIYGGGQVGADFHGVSFTDNGNSTLSSIRSSDPLLNAVAMPNLIALGSMTTKAPSFGGFIGYNYQVDDIVVGMEFNFNQTSSSAAASQSQTANPSALFNGVITLNGPTKTSTVPGFSSTITSSTLYIPTSLSASNSATANLLDYGTVRVRAGWAYGNFLPYVAVGMSVSRIDSAQTLTAHYVGTGTTTTTTSTVPNPQTTPTATPPTITVVNGGPVPVNLTYTATQASTGKYNFGFSVAAGIDYELTHNIFLRGELEYLQLGTMSNITMNTASARIGGGLKF
jgi:opacity protein-like surface antigen